MCFCQEHTLYCFMAYVTVPGGIGEGDCYLFFIKVFYVGLFIDLVRIVFVPVERFFQAFLQRFELGHELNLGGDVEAVFVVIKAEIVSLFDILVHVYKFGPAAGGVIA